MLATAVTLMFVNAWRVDAAPGDSDTTFVPIAPGCRFADTRQAGQGGPIGAGQVRSFTAHGTHNACTIPADAVALLMNVTVDGQTATNSFLTIWGNGANPGTSALNPAAGEPPTPNAVTTDLTPTGVFNIFNDAGFVNVIIDINGYHTKTSLTALERAQPFAVTNTETTDVNLTVTPTAFVSVTVTAPVAGHVTINSTAYVFHSVDGGDLWCAIYEDAAIPPTGLSSDEPSFQRWETGGLGNEGSLSGTRRFDIAANATTTYSLACEELANGGVIATGNLTAIFTPAP
jgi:hypothetical protein